MKEILARFEKTFQFPGDLGRPLLPPGFFCNVLDIGGIGLAVTTDGVGSKTLICSMLDRYDTIGIDLVAANCNDLMAVGARPVSIVNYIAMGDKNKAVLYNIARGIYTGALWANVSVSGGETAFLKGVLSDDSFDLSGTAMGIVPLDRIITGEDVMPGDVILGVESNGIHVNGLSLAREVLFEKAGFTVYSKVPELGGRTLGDELLRTTYVYAKEVQRLFDWAITPHAIVPITGGGLLNLKRVAAPDVGFEMDRLPPMPGILSLIQRKGEISDEVMYETFNCGMGLCVVVPEGDAERALRALISFGKASFRVGQVVRDSKRSVISAVPGREFVLRGDKLSL